MRGSAIEASSVAEAIFGRGLSWAVVIGNGAICLVLVALIPWVARDDFSVLQWAVYGALIVAWGVSTFGVALLLVVRPRHSMDDFVLANQGGGRELRVPGSARSSRAQTLTAASWAVLAVLASALLSTGWRVFVLLVAAALVCAVIDQGLAARQPRYLVLGADGIEAGGFTGAAAIRWDDIEAISVQQAPGGQLVLRVQAKEQAPSWRRVSKHPWHRDRRTVDIEPLTLDVDPLRLSEVVLGLWESESARRGISSHALAARLAG